jgi:hypothetical protein
MNNVTLERLAHYAPSRVSSAKSRLRQRLHFPQSNICPLMRVAPQAWQNPTVGG